MTLHEVVLGTHNLLRWVVLVTGVTAFIRSVAGSRAGREWRDADTKWLRVFVGAFDLQVLLGLFMYFATSALGVRMLQHMSMAMKSSVLRFFAVEHIGGMLVAAALIHVGTTRARRLGDSSKRHARTAIVVGIAFLIVFFSIPWPFFPYARPLVRFG